MTYFEGYDRLVDTIATRADRLKGGALKYAEKHYPLERLHHGLQVIDVLSERLALAEYGLRRRWTFVRYKDFSKQMGVWFQES